MLVASCPQLAVEPHVCLPGRKKGEGDRDERGSAHCSYFFALGSETFLEILGTSVLFVSYWPKLNPMASPHSKYRKTGICFPSVSSRKRPEKRTLWMALGLRIPSVSHGTLLSRLFMRSIIKKDLAGKRAESMVGKSQVCVVYIYPHSCSRRPNLSVEHFHYSQK